MTQSIPDSFSPLDGMPDEDLIRELINRFHNKGGACVFAATDLRLADGRRGFHCASAGHSSARIGLVHQLLIDIETRFRRDIEDQIDSEEDDEEGDGEY